MTEREYLPVDAPFVSTGLFQTKNSLGSSRPPIRIGGISNPSELFSSRILNEKPSARLYTSSLLQGSNMQLYQNIGHPYLPTSEGLAKFLASPSVHLTPGRMVVSAQPEVLEGYTPMSTPSLEKNEQYIAPMSSLKKCLIGKSGNRLPSVLKKALPLPPEDIRSVPHVRIQRMNSPPVVSVGMVDLDGIPTPWSKSPELKTSLVAKIDKQDASKADQVRERMRQDFDDIQEFIENAFSDKTAHLDEKFIF